MCNKKKFIEVIMIKVRQYLITREFLLTIIKKHINNKISHKYQMKLLISE